MAPCSNPLLGPSSPSSAALQASHPCFRAPFAAAALGWAAPHGSLGESLFLHIGLPPITQSYSTPFLTPFFAFSHSHSGTLLLSRIFAFSVPELSFFLFLLISTPTLLLFLALDITPLSLHPFLANSVYV